MGIPFRHMRYRLHRLMLHGTREAERTTFDAPSTISPDQDTVAQASRIIVPYIEDAYGKSSRSTAAGLAKALEVLKTLENADQSK